LSPAGAFPLEMCLNPHFDVIGSADIEAVIF
jgi:hypothetical protein